MPVIEMIEPAPKGFSISREDWARTPTVVRDDIIRIHRELSERIPIAKDIAAGRAGRRPGKSDFGKRVRGGFWELHTLEQERQPSPTHLARMAELREALGSEIAHWAAVEAHQAELAPFYAMAKAAGKTLPDVLRAYVGVESRLRADFLGEFQRIAENVGVDIYEWAEAQLEADVA